MTAPASSKRQLNQTQEIGNNLSPKRPCIMETRVNKIAINNLKEIDPNNLPTVNNEKTKAKPPFNAFQKFNINSDILAKILHMSGNPLAPQVWEKKLPPINQNFQEDMFASLIDNPVIMSFIRNCRPALGEEVAKINGLSPSQEKSKQEKELIRKIYLAVKKFVKPFIEILPPHLKEIKAISSFGSLQELIIAGENINLILFYKILEVKFNQIEERDPNLIVTRKPNLTGRLESQARRIRHFFQRADINPLISQLTELTISESIITAIPPEIARLTLLSKLTIELNPHLMHIPDEIGSLVLLERLSINQTEISDFPARKFANLVNLKTLELISNEIVHIPDDLLNGLSQLIEIDFSENNITHLPENLFATNPRLETVILNDNALSNLPDYIFTPCTSIISLNLGDNLIEEIGSWIVSTPNLIELDLSDNEIQTISNNIISLQFLSWLDISSNNIKKISPSLGQLLNLEILFLDDNYLTELSDSLNNHPKLQFLSLQGNLIKIHKLPKLPNLIELSLEGNGIKEINEGIKSKLYPKLKILDISSNKLSKIPPKLLNELVILEAANNRITSLPSNFMQTASKLRKLNLSLNQISEISCTLLRRWVDLKILNLSDNRFKTIPKEFNRLWYLKTLNLQQNRISSIELAPGDLRKLEEVSISNNRLNLNTPPDFISELQRRDSCKVAL